MIITLAKASEKYCEAKCCVCVNEGAGEMAKTAETYAKVAETFTRKGNTEWAKAKSGEGDEHYGIAKGFYATAEKARQKEQELRSKG